MPPRLAIARDPDEVFLAAYDKLPAAFRQCRSMSHSWDSMEALRRVDSNREVDAQPIKGETVYARRTVECATCGMRRRDYYRIASRMVGGQRRYWLVKIGAGYQPPIGYAIKGAGRARGLRGYVLGAEYEASLAAEVG